MELIWLLVFTGEFTIKIPASIVQDKKPEPGSEKIPWLGSEVMVKESVAKQLQMDEEGNVLEISQLERIVKQTNDDFHKVLKLAADGCEKIIPKIESNHEKNRFKFFRWIILNTFFMRNYAKTGEKNIMKTVLANILLIGFQPLMMLFGLITAPIEWNKRRKENKLYKAAVNQERERAKSYREIIA